MAKLGLVETQTSCDHLASLSSDLAHIPTPDTPCYRCQDPNDNWLCLCYKDVLCSRYSNNCLALGYRCLGHVLFTFGNNNLLVWCFSCNAFLDAQVIMQLQPVYDRAYIPKFGEAPTFCTV
ncbi:hypothetical protein ACJW30_01G237900 [Castanea mollissima]